jgi:hypothetical protein
MKTPQYDPSTKGFPDASITCTVVHLSDGSTASVRAEAPLTVEDIEKVERFINDIKLEVTKAKLKSMNCHCGKDGHALGSINCPVHGSKP